MEKKFAEIINEGCKAGKTVRVETPEGTYDITWDEGGHPEKAVRV